MKRKRVLSIYWIKMNSRFNFFYPLLILLFVFINSEQFLYSQISSEDSVKLAVNKLAHKNETHQLIEYIKLNFRKKHSVSLNFFLHNSLAEAYEKQNNYKFALAEYKQAYFQLLGKGDTPQFVDVALKIINLELYTDNFDKAKFFFERIAPYVKSFKNDSDISGRYLYFQSVYFWSIGEFAKAYINAFKAERIFSKDSQSIYLPKIYQILGNIYFSMNNYPMAESFYYESINLFKKNNDISGISFVNNNLGEIARNKSFDVLAVKFHKQAIKFGLEADCSLCLIYAYINLAEDFLELNKSDSALYYLNLSEKYSKQVRKNDLEALIYIHKMRVFKNKKEMIKARNMLGDAIEITSIGVRRDTKTQVYTSAIDFYREIGKVDLALKYSQRLYLSEKRIKTRNIVEIISKMSDEQSVVEQKIKSLTATKNSAEQKTLIQRFYIYLVLFFLLVSLSLSFLIYRLYDKMRNQNLQLARQNKSILDAETNLQVANESLHKIAFKFKSIIEKLPILVYARDKLGNFIFWNEEAERLTGYSQNLFEHNDRALSVLIPDKSERLKIENAFVIGEFKWIETDILTLTNETKRLAWISVSESTPISGWKDWGIAIDITSRHNFERYLERERAILHSIIRSIPFMISYKNLKGEYLGYNPAFKELFGETQVLVGKTDFDLYSRKKALRNQEIENTIIKDKNIYAEEKWMNAGKDKKILLHTLKFPFENSRKEVLGIVVLSRDITDRYEFEQVLQAQKEKAETSDKLKSAFLANMSHEIRTPLNAIIGFADLLKNKNINEAQKAKYIKYINSSGNTLLTLIDDIIDTAKIEAGQLKIRRGRVYLNRLLDEVYATHKEIKNKLDKKNVELILVKEILDKNFSFYSDSHRLKQILTNLIGNALKFVDSGYIKFGYKKIDTLLRFYVEDTGIGIAKDKHSIIFERFGQVESSYKKNFKGTGLGLAITKKLVELLGGRIWLESEENSGAKFYFTLPYIERKMEKEEIVNSNFQLPFIPGKSILIVEDDRLNYIVLKNILDRTRAKTMWKHNGKEALDLVKQNDFKIDIILMDIQMPLMNGNEATVAIRKINKKIPIIALTAYVLEGEKEQMLAAGCNEYLTKPIKADLLYEVINKHLKNEN